MRAWWPAPSDLEGARVWSTATVRLADTSSVVLPVSAGVIVWQADQWPATRVNGLTVPAVDDAGTDLVGAGLLGSNGHRVTLALHAEMSGGRRQDLTLGTFLVRDVARDGAGVRVEAVDLSQLVIDHLGAVPRAVSRVSPLRETLVGLLSEDGVAAVVRPGWTTPTVPHGFTVGTDRGGSLRELLEAGRVHLYPSGVSDLEVVPVPALDGGTPVAVFRDGVDGTLIDATLHLRREDLWNHIIVPVAGSERVAEAAQREGPYAVGRFGWRSRRLDNAAIGSLAQAQAVAVNELARSMVRAGTIPVESVPDWRLEPYDTVLVERSGGSWLGVVTGLEVPLVAGMSMVSHVGVRI